MQVLGGTGRNSSPLGSENLFGTRPLHHGGGALPGKTWNLSSVEIGLSFINGWKMVWLRFGKAKAPGGRGHRDSPGSPDLL